MIIIIALWGFTLVFCYLSIQWFILRHVRYKDLKKFPGQAPTFLIGNITWVIGLYMRAKKLLYPPAVYVAERIMGSTVLHLKTGMYAFWMGPEPVVPIYKAEILEQVLGSTVSLEKSYEYIFLHKWLGTGLLTSHGEKWKQRRKILTPSFHFRILEDFFPVFNQQSLILVEKLKSLANSEYVDITSHIVLCTLDVICETVMGVSIGAQRGENFEYVRAIHNLADFFNQRVVAPWLWKDFLFGLTRMGRAYNRDIRTLHDFTNRVIKEKKEELLKKGSSEDCTAENEDEYYTKKRRTFMDLLLELHMSGQQLSEADIREEVDTFMFEGHDTTAVGITFALYCIGLYPEVQKKVEAEMGEIFGDNKERPITHDDTRNMKYLECVLKESQRLFPSVPIIGRITKEPVQYGDLTIPIDTTIHCCIIALHRNPEFFPNPEVFDPDRFLPENSISRHPYAYIPFSAGPRNCIGQKFAMLEEKTVVSNILRHFKLVSLDQRDQFQLKIEFTLRPAQEVRLKFIPR